jgi:hypothetical protein
VVPEVFRKARPIKAVTMARATLNNGQTIHAVNDLFIGPKSHGSARYLIKLGDQKENQSSSGVIVSTGMGSSGWFSSLITGAKGVSAAFTAAATKGRAVASQLELGVAPSHSPRFPWNADHLYFTVREPFPSKTTGTSLVFGRIGVNGPLEIDSLMPERGVIFSDGIEADFLEFNSGSKATICVAERQGRLVA